MGRLNTAQGNREAAARADKYAAQARKAGNEDEAKSYESFAREARRTADDIDRNSR